MQARKSAVFLCVLAIALAGAGGFAIAAIPDNSGAINACYKKVGGQLRVVDGVACASDESPLSWWRGRAATEAQLPFTLGAVNWQTPGGCNAPSTNYDEIARCSDVDPDDRLNIPVDSTRYPTGARGYLDLRITAGPNTLYCVRLFNATTQAAVAGSGVCVKNTGTTYLHTRLKSGLFSIGAGANDYAPQALARQADTDAGCPSRSACVGQLRNGRLILQWSP
jgi:hypothetical protein